MWAAKQGLAALSIRWDDGPNAKVSTADVVQELDAASQQPGVVARKEGDAAAAIVRAAVHFDLVRNHAVLLPAITSAIFVSSDLSASLSCCVVGAPALCRLAAATV